MNVRRLRKGDSTKAYELRLRGLAAAPDAFLVTLDEEQARGPGHYDQMLAKESDDLVVFGAFVDGLVGMVGVYRFERRKVRHRAEIWGMFVDANARGKGIGAALLDRAIGHARGIDGVTQLRLSVAGDNPAARGLYESRGFRCWGVEASAMKDGERALDEHHYVLVL
ncbi:MAG: GNAT family N-acetyltransferase [Myxococcota bacterium]